MMIKKTHANVFILHGVLFLLLEISFYHIVVPNYDDYGFTFQFDVARYLIGKSLLVISLIVVSRLDPDDFLFSVLNILIAFFLTPNLIVFQFMDCSLAISLGILSIPFFAVAMERLVPNIKGRSIPLHQRPYALLALSAALLIPFFVAFGFSISSDALSFERIYFLRAESGKLSTSLTDYTYSFLSTWVIPLCLIYGYWTKKWLVVIFSLVSLLYLYAITGNKITFFVIFVVIGFLFLSSYKAKTIGVLASFALMCAIGLVFFDSLPFIQDMFIRRMLFLPALLNLQYFEFFSDNPLYYSHSFLRGVIDYPYSLPPPRMIGVTYYHGGNMTNGVVSDGFLNLGVPGILGNCFLASVIIVFFSKLRIHPIFLGLFFLLVQKFIDSAMLTGLLTHGIFAFMIISVFFIGGTNTRNDIA